MTQADYKAARDIRDNFLSKKITREVAIKSLMEIAGRYGLKDACCNGCDDEQKTKAYSEFLEIFTQVCGW